MAYPEKLLGEDEEVILDLHQHWKMLVLPIIKALLIVGVGVFLITYLKNNYDGTASNIGVYVLLALMAVGLVWGSFWPYLKWVTTQYVVTNKRVVIRSGVFSRDGRDVPLSRVNDVSFHHDLLDRMLGCGTITVESAGERGQVVLSEVPHVEEVQRTIYRLAEVEERGGTHGVEPVSDGT